MCPECGRIVKVESGLLRTRRRWRWVSVGVLALISGGAVVLYPSGRGGQWKNRLPDTALVLIFSWTDEMWPLDVLDSRYWDGEGGVTFVHEDALSQWQNRWVTMRCAEIIGEDRPVKELHRAMFWIMWRSEDPKPAIGSFLECMDNPDVKVAQQAAGAIVALRYELGDMTEQCRQSLVESGAGYDRMYRETVEFGLLDFPSPTQSNHVDAGDREAKTPQLTPAQVEEQLAGAFTSDAIRVYQNLGISSRHYTVPYSIDAGPLQVDRFEVELDGKDGMDAVVRIGDKNGMQWQFLVFLSDHDGWHLVETLNTSGMNANPKLRVERGTHGERWLVMTSSMGRGKNYLLASDSWLEVTQDGIRGVLSAPRNGYYTNATIVDWELSAESIVLDTTDGMSIEYSLKATLMASEANAAASDPLVFFPDEPVPLLDRREVVMYVWNGSRFVLETGQVGWPDAGLVYDLLQSDADTTLELYAQEIRTLAKSDDPWVLRWVRNLLSQCGESELKAEVRRVLEERESDSRALDGSP